MEKHKKVEHENLKLFCHFYNNGKDCPNNDNCVFLHEESGPCTYMESCERELCMYEHEEESDDEESDNGENEEDETERTLFNPSHSEDSDCEGKEYNCEMCQFKTEDKSRYKRHKLESHSVIGKYTCFSYNTMK